MRYSEFVCHVFHLLREKYSLAEICHTSNTQQRSRRFLCKQMKYLWWGMFRHHRGPIVWWRSILGNEARAAVIGGPDGVEQVGEGNKVSFEFCFLLLFTLRRNYWLLSINNNKDAFFIANCIFTHSPFSWTKTWAQEQ